jgi:hypothetical protein
MIGSGSAMEGMSERAYSAHSGLSRGAVQKARRSGRLVLHADGSIDALASDARRGATTDPDQQLRSRGGAARSDGAAGGGGQRAGPVSPEVDWQEVTGSVAAPAGARSAEVRLVRAAGGSGVLYATGLEMLRQRAGATLIRPGSVTSAQILAGSLSADDIRAGKALDRVPRCREPDAHRRGPRRPRRRQVRPRRPVYPRRLSRHRCRRGCGWRWWEVVAARPAIPPASPSSPAG